MESHIDRLIENQKWPKQCKGINKYLLEIDLSTIINLKSIKKELLLCIIKIEIYKLVHLAALI